MYSVSSISGVKRCPHCGNKYPSLIDNDGSIYIQCSTCGFKTEEYYFTDKHKVIEEWNSTTLPWHVGIPEEEGTYICKLYYKDLKSPWHILIWIDGKWRIPHIENNNIIKSNKVEKWQLLEEKTE